MAPWAGAAATALVAVCLLAAEFSGSQSLADADAVPHPAAAAKDEPIDGGNALLYAKALHDNNCAEVVRLTAWMSDRLRRVALESSDPANVQEAKNKLCAKALARPYEDNVLRFEGIEDQFVFTPGAQFEVISKDKGREDLNDAVGERVWIRVTYPKRETAPLAPISEMGPDMKPVRQWTVGVNIGRDSETVVKAAVTGNLEIDTKTAVFDWPER